MRPVAFVAILLLVDYPLAAQPASSAKPAFGEVRLTDGSRIFLSLHDSEVAIATPYGRLVVKLADIQRVDFGTRVPQEDAKKAAEARELIHGDDEKKRDEGWRALSALGELAYPTLVEFTRGTDKDVASRASQMAQALRKAIPAAKLDKIERDVVHTDVSKIVGRIETSSFRVTTAQFGARMLQASHLMSIRFGTESESDEIPVNVQPDPGYLSNFGNQVGSSFYFRVTGRAGGSVWGSDVYTTDSQLSTVAIHAGILKPGQTGIVKVTILPGQNGYSGTVRNGISTSGYGEYPSSYKVSRVGPRNDRD